MVSRDDSGGDGVCAWNPEANDIFLKANEIEESAVRLQFLDDACGRNTPLRAEVESLLDASDRAGSFLDRPPTDAAVAIEALQETSSVPERLGSMIGPYRLLEQIGEGGLGTVFLAEQAAPVRRRVALKVIKPGMDTKQVIGRFEAERQALALMDHPHVARFFDAGQTDAGRAYFVMEHVPGMPITDYCDTGRLRIRQRLELFVSICHAVQHAHQKGVIHRDLKPSNILVTLVDGKPVPKVIDFGIAKATAAPLTDRTLHTEIGRLMGTPEYMSPEQAGSGGVDVDTRSDLYSLGVILYQLLTGTLPFEPKTLRQADYSSLVRIICELEPPKPSTRLSTLGSEPVNQHNGATPKEIAERRATDFAALRRQVRGELDWIVMKCLEKDRSRRYETANGLAMDVQRYLADEPVVAGPPSTTYRLRKFVRRNRTLVAAAGGLAVILLVATIGMSLLASWALRERGRAITAGDEAHRRADELKQVSDFQAQMLAQVDPAQAGRLLEEDVNARYAKALAAAGVPDEAQLAQIEQFKREWQRVNRTDAARELIDRTILQPAVEAIETQFKDQPVVDAGLRQTLADRYRELGMYDASLPLQEQAVDTRRRLLGDDHPDTLNSITNLGILLMWQGKLPEAEVVLREALDRCRAALGEEHRYTLAAINNMGNLLEHQGKWNEAEPYYRETLEKQRRVLGEEHPDTLTSINNVASVLQSQERLEDAERYYRDALERHRRVLGEEHPTTLRQINNLGSVLNAQGRYADAEPLYRDALEKRRRILGEEHQNTLTSLNNLGLLLQAQGKLGEAEGYFREALDKRRQVLGDDHPDTLSSMSNMGFLLRLLGRYAEAEPYYRETLDRRRRALGEEHPDTLIATSGVGSILWSLGRMEEAEPYYYEALEKCRRVLGENHRDTLVALHNMASLLKTQGKLPESEAFYRESLEKHQKVLGPDHPNTMPSLHNLAAVIRDQGRFSEAREFFVQALANARGNSPGDHPRIAMCLHHLAEVVHKLGEHEEAHRLVSESLAMYRQHPEWDPGEYRHALEVLVTISRDTGQTAEAADALREKLDVQRRSLSPDSVELASALAATGSGLLGLEEYGAAVDVVRECLSLRQRLLPDDHPQAWLTYDAMSLLGEALVGAAEHDWAGTGNIERAVAQFREAEEFLLASCAKLNDEGAVPPPTPQQDHKKEAHERIVKLYDSWNAVEPELGYDVKAAEWRAKLEALDQAAPVDDAVP